MTEKISKTYRVTPRIAKALHLLAVQNDLPLGDIFAALLRLQSAPQHFTRQEDKKLFETVWGQAVLSAKRAGKSGWTGKSEPGVVVIVDENTDAE